MAIGMATNRGMVIESAVNRRAASLCAVGVFTTDLSSVITAEYWVFQRIIIDRVSHGIHLRGLVFEADTLDYEANG